MLDHFAEIVAKHKGAAILLDANLLLLLVVGRSDRRRVESFSRTSMFKSTDFDTLVKILDHFSRIVTTPNILTEVSNLAGHLEGEARARCFEILKSAIEVIDERFITSTDACSELAFARLGLTDAGIVRLADAPLPVLTTDFDLWHHLAASGVDALNFNHVRTLAW